MQKAFSMNQTIKNLLLVCTIVPILAGCIAPRTPAYQNSSFDTSAVDEITVLSVIDARDDKTRKPDLYKKLNKIIPVRVKIHMGRKGYKVRQLLDPALTAGITRGAVEKADPNWIKSIGPSDARWVMVWSVNQLSHKAFDFDSVGFGASGKSGMAAVLFDKATGTIAWRDEITQEVKAGILFSPVSGLLENDALTGGILTLVAGFPKKSKK